MNLSFQRVPAVVAVCLAPLAFAAAGAADPTQALPGTSLPPYRSAFSDYKPLKEDKPGDWRALNDAVKGEGMAGMAGMAGMPGMPGMDMGKGMGMGKDTHDGMPGMGKMPGHALPMPMPKPGAASGPTKAPARAAAASTPAMDGMPAMKGMPGHSAHEMQGGKP